MDLTIHNQLQEFRIELKKQQDRIQEIREVLMTLGERQVQLANHMARLTDAMSALLKSK